MGQTETPKAEKENNKYVRREDREWVNEREEERERVEEKQRQRKRIRS